MQEVRESQLYIISITYQRTAELNLPYYPFLRRNVDCIIALDASADSQVFICAIFPSYPNDLNRTFDHRTSGSRGQKVIAIPTSVFASESNVLQNLLPSAACKLGRAVRAGPLVSAHQTTTPPTIPKQTPGRSRSTKPRHPAARTSSSLRPRSPHSQNRQNDKD